MKIAVYAIAKNEEQFVDRFMESCEDADFVLIGDTGSTDNTATRAFEAGAFVRNININPFRFDDARNATLALLPSDIDFCISLDLDEVLQPGWRAEVERLCTTGVNRLRYKFDWGDGVVFTAEKCHARRGYRWRHPCHETVVPYGIQEQAVVTDKLLIVHKPDPTKPRSQYLSLLKMGVEEDPNDPSHAFYYSRELYFHGEWRAAIQECLRYLALPNAVSPNERCYALRVCVWCYTALRELMTARMWAEGITKQYPTQREAWYSLATVNYHQKDWKNCLIACTNGLAITQRSNLYTDDPIAWSHGLYDLMSISYFNLGHKELAQKYAAEAVSHSPDDPRLRRNLELMSA